MNTKTCASQGRFEVKRKMSHNFVIYCPISKTEKVPVLAHQLVDICKCLGIDFQKCKKFTP